MLKSTIYSIEAIQQIHHAGKGRRNGKSEKSSQLSRGRR